MTYVNCSYSGCDDVVSAVMYVDVFVEMFHTFVLLVIFMHAKEIHLLNSVCTFAFLSNKVSKIFCQVNCKNK